MKLSRIAALVLAVPFLLAGCNTFERTTFQTLSASKAVLDTAQSDYEAGTPIPHNACAYALINDGKAAQTTAVNAMLTYEGVKAAKADLTAITATVSADLFNLAPLVVKIQALITNPAAVCGGK